MRKADVRKKQQQQSKVQKDRSSLNKQENKLSFFFFSLLNVKDDKKDKLEYREKKGSVQDYKWEEIVCFEENCYVLIRYMGVASVCSPLV